jgi:hypothetical protein
MYFRVLVLSPWSTENSVRVAMIASILCGSCGYMLIVRVEEDVLIRTWVGKGRGICRYNIGDITRYLTFAKDTVRLGLACCCEEQV